MRVAVLSLCWIVAAASLVTGCVSKAKADAQARAAFLAGQQQALTQHIDLAVFLLRHGIHPSSTSFRS